MSGPEIEALRALYRDPEPDVETLRADLLNVGDGLFSQCHALHDAPSESACERLAANLEGARRHVLRLADAIRKETAK